MTDSTSAGAKAPWHLWVVGVLGLLWNAFGAFDFTMSMTKGEAYFRSMGMNDVQIAYFTAMPTWTFGPWALGVWGAVAGSILLLLRSRWGFHANVVSLFGLLVSLVYTHLMSKGGEIMGAQGMVMNVVITAACVFFVWYSWAMMKRGVLR